MVEAGVPGREAAVPEITDRPATHWILIFLGIYGIWVWLPWLAPLLMHAGLTTAGHLVYAIYSVFCHQLPERSFFLFGRLPMYSLSAIQAAWQDTLNPMVLRQFVGNTTMGWKVAWSDRMVSFYTSVWVAGVIWWPNRRRFGPLAWWAFLLLLLPMGLDGLSHAVSDIAGLGNGFRDSNAWLVTLTNGRLPMAYAGDALGSFNSWARLITGVLAGIGVALFAFPSLERSVGSS